MERRRPLLAVLLLAAALHALGIARTALPAQDGLKFLRVASAFQREPWGDVVRGTDQHPLYPALVALAEPAVRLLLGPGPETWRLAAQGVSAVAALALLFPLHALSRSLFDTGVADLATLGFVLLPLPMAVGHDTLSDSLALCACATALWLGVRALREAQWGAAVGCGAVAGLGFLTRPEVLVVPLSVVLAGLALRLRGAPFRAPALPRLSAVGVAFLVVVGAYATVKGEVSEKLALRGPGATRGARVAKPEREPGHWLPRGLDSPGWDFAPKEEGAVVPRSLGAVARDLVSQWADGLGSLLAVFAVWGLVRDRFIRGSLSGSGGGARPDPANVARLLLLSYLVLFAAILVRHELKMGYLSGRHTLTLVLVALPWAAAGVHVCSRRLAGVLSLTRGQKRFAGAMAVAVAVATGGAVQAKPSHPSRWGHRQAGLWLRAHARPGEAVLDTRGWAAFVSGLPAYDYWHVRQALSDSRLAYVVVGDDELRADSGRARTLRAWLAYAAEPVVAFPEQEGGEKVGPRVYRYARPASWEGLKP